jgi:hypothetical protein
MTYNTRKVLKLLIQVLFWLCLIWILFGCATVKVQLYHVVSDKQMLDSTLARYSFTDRGKVFYFFNDSNLYHLGDTIDYENIVCYPTGR